MGFEQSSCTLIGRSIGQGSLSEAKHFYRLFNILSTIFCGCLVLVMYLFKGKIIRIYNEDEAIVDKALSVVVVLSFSTFPDTYKAMLKGVIRALAL